MGSSAEEIIRDYRELVHPDRVPDYWDIFPRSAQTVEQLDFTAAGFGG